ncbi:hypothetical protein CR983_02945 [Candidatus Saccharibacteria bacterium]|nr:MAG: hypothetical protein CR983_02945 [Candidatus Saccharibacteria bacterium]
MSKVSTYLQGHITGEVLTRADVRASLSRDSGVLERRPEMVIYPHNANDIRKLACFSSQLVAKGHILELTARGDGTDTTGASLGSGASIVLSRHMSRVLEFEPRQRLVRMHAGASIATLQNILEIHGARIPTLPLDDSAGTIGGAIACDSTGELAGCRTTIASAVRQLEVVLDSGDVLQTGPISARAYRSILGKPGRIGDIYRGVDTVLEDHRATIADLRKAGVVDRSGYPGITQVQQKGGGVDLTPLFVGSQGTLGIITEVIMHADQSAVEPSISAATFTSADKARDAVAELRSMPLAMIEYYDGELFAQALTQGNSYQWIDKPSSVQALVVIASIAPKARARSKNLKKAEKLLAKHGAHVYSSDDQSPEQLWALRSLVRYHQTPDTMTLIAPPVVGSLYIPFGRLEAFMGEYSALCQALNVSAPLYGSILSGSYTICPAMSLKKSSDKQKLLKLIDQLTSLAVKHNGALVGAGGEGRLLSPFVRAAWDEPYEKLTRDIKTVFDPHGIFNPGAKSHVDIKTLAREIRSDSYITSQR